MQGRLPTRSGIALAVAKPPFGLQCSAGSTLAKSVGMSRLEYVWQSCERSAAMLCDVGQAC